MAASDYRLCDLCERKAFYDARLNYSWDKGRTPVRRAGKDENGPSVDYVGDWAVLCADCAKTHQTMIVPLPAASVARGEEEGE